MKYLLALLISSFCLAQTVTPTYILPKIKSSISLPISVPVSEINNMVNQSVKGVIYEDQSFTDNDNDQLKVKVEKLSDISIKALSNNRLMISVPLKIWAEKGYGTFGYYAYKDTKFDVVMNFISSIAINPDWSMKSQTSSAGFVWKTKPVLDYGKIKIPVAPIIETVLNKQQKDFTSIIDQQIASAFNLKPYLLQVWNQFSTPINVSEEYNTWLKISPQSVYMMPLSVFSNTIKTNVGLDLYSETFVGQVPDKSQPISVFPNFISKTEIPSEFNLQTTANISFDEATRLAKNQFLGKEFLLGKDHFKIIDITVYPEKENVVVEAKTEGKVNGTAFIKGKMAYDSINHKIILTKTDFNLKTKNFFQKALTVLFEGKIRGMIEKDYGIPLLDIENNAKQSLHQNFNKEYYKGIRLQGKVIDLKPTQFLLSEKYITVVIDTKAQLQMNISGLSF